MKQHNKRGVALIIAAIITVTLPALYFTVDAKAPDKTKETPNPKVVEQNSKIDEPTLEISTETEIKEDVPVVEEFVGYTTDPLRVRVEPNTECEILDVYQVNTEVTYVIENDHWIKIKYNDKDAYMCKDYISDTMVEVVVVEEVVTEQVTEEVVYYNNNTSGENYNYNYNGGALTPSAGVFYGPSGKETYYNLDMSGVISIMRGMGNNDEYWVREDGVKMLGAYVMVAADLNIYPRGSLVPTSLGTGIVCDTGGFASNGSGVALDIATAW